MITQTMNLFIEAKIQDLKTEWFRNYHEWKQIGSNEQKTKKNFVKIEKKNPWKTGGFNNVSGSNKTIFKDNYLIVNVDAEEVQLLQTRE